jgi:hypothetical protein
VTLDEYWKQLVTRVYTHHEVLRGSVEQTVAMLLDAPDSHRPMLDHVEAIYARLIPLLEELAVRKDEFGLREGLFVDTGEP